MTSKIGKKIGQARNKAYDLARAGLRTAYVTIPAGLYALSEKAPEFLREVYSHVPFLNGRESQALQATQQYSPVATGISAGLLTGYLLDRKLETAIPNSPKKRAIAKNLGCLTFANLGNFLIEQFSSAVANASSSTTHGIEELVINQSGSPSRESPFVPEIARAIKDNLVGTIENAAGIMTNFQNTDFSDPKNMGYCAVATLLAIPAAKIAYNTLKTIGNHLFSTPTKTYEERRILRDLEKSERVIRRRVE